MYLKNYQILYEKFSSKLKLKSKSSIVTKGLYKKQGRKDLVAKEDFFLQSHGFHILFYYLYMLYLSYRLAKALFSFATKKKFELIPKHFLVKHFIF